MMMQIKAEPISSAGFAAYGELLENKTDQRRKDFTVQFATYPDIAPQLWVNRLARCTDTAVLIDVMENHPYSAQTFVPMQPGRCLVVVALGGADGKPDLSTLRAFVTAGGQGVSYLPKVWHYTFSSLDGPNEVVVIMGNTGRGDDTVIEKISRPVEVVFSGDQQHG